MSTVYQEKDKLFAEAAQLKKGRDMTPCLTKEVVDYVAPPYGKEEKTQGNTHPMGSKKQEQVRKLLKEYIGGCQRFSLQGFHGFIKKKHEDDSETMKSNPSASLNKELQLEKEILDKLDNDCKHFRAMAMEAYLKKVLEILKPAKADPLEFVWAASQFAELNCTMNNNRLTISGRVHHSRNTFEITSYDVTEHMEAMRAEKAKQDRRSGAAAYKDGIMGKVEKVADVVDDFDPRRSPIASMKYLKESLGCPSAASEVDVSLLGNRDLLFKMLYALTPTFGIRARKDLNIQYKGSEFLM